MGVADLSFPKNFKVGKPSMLIPATSLRVESTFAITMFGLLAILWAAFSYSGAKLLQWPHHGA